MKLSILVVSVFIISFAHGEQRIAGGEVTTISNYPFATALLSNGGGNTLVQSCGGTILTSSAILSSASCFYTEGTLDPVSWWRARAGSSYGAYGGYIYLIRTITPHPDFSVTTMLHDIAVLRTTFTITLLPGLVEVARIAGAAYSLETNQEIWAIGWGITSSTAVTNSEQLRHVQFWVVNQTTCANRYSELGYTISDNQVCVGWLDVGVLGQCQGDGGSPLVNNGVVVGVYSWSQGCAQGWYPSINTKISSYTRWIVQEATAQH